MIFSSFHRVSFQFVSMNKKRHRTRLKSFFYCSQLKRWEPSLHRGVKVDAMNTTWSNEFTLHDQRPFMTQKFFTNLKHLESLMDYAYTQYVYGFKSDITCSLFEKQKHWLKANLNRTKKRKDDYWRGKKASSLKQKSHADMAKNIPKKWSVGKFPKEFTKSESEWMKNKKKQIHYTLTEWAVWWTSTTTITQM